MARKKTLKVGARVQHVSNKELDEGVVVFIQKNESNITVKNNSPFSVHWACGKRGHYSLKEIQRINPTSTLKQLKKEVLDDGEK